MDWVGNHRGSTNEIQIHIFTLWLKISNTFWSCNNLVINSSQKLFKYTGKWISNQGRSGEYVGGIACLTTGRWAGSSSAVRVLLTFRITGRSLLGSRVIWNDWVCPKFSDYVGSGIRVAPSCFKIRPEKGRRPNI